MKRKNKEGYALMIVMLVCAILTTAGTVGWQLAGSASMRARFLTKRAQALTVAEAGIATMYSDVIYMTNSWNSLSITQSCGKGSFKVDAVNLDNIILIASKGEVDDVTVKTEIEVIYITDPRVLSGEYSMIAGGDIVLETTAMDIVKDVHANSNINSTKGNPKVAGNLTAVGTVAITPLGGFSATENSATIMLPEESFFASWEYLAKNGGTYIDGDYTGGGTEIAPPNGVLFVNGDILIENKTTMIGTMVATGSITIQNKFDQTLRDENWPAMASGANIELFNRNRYDGSFFATGNFISRNNKVINGVIIALGNIEIQNNCTVSPLRGFIIDPFAEDKPKYKMGAWVE